MRMGRSTGSGKAYPALTATLAIGVASLLLLLYLRSRDEDEPARASAAPSADIPEATNARPTIEPDDARPAPPPLPAETPPVPDPPAKPTADEEKPETAPPSIDSNAAYKEAQLARGRSEVRRAAATCLRGDDTERDEDLFIFQYNLVGKRGAVGPADLEVLQNNISDRDLEECIIERIRDVGWSADGPEIRVAVPDSFTVGDLKKLPR